MVYSLGRIKGLNYNYEVVGTAQDTGLDTNAKYIKFESRIK